MLLAAGLLLVIDTAITIWITTSIISFIDRMKDGYVKQQLYVFISNKVVSALLNFGISWVIAMLTAEGFWAGITNLGATVLSYLAANWYVNIHTTLPELRERLQRKRDEKVVEKQQAEAKAA